MADSIWVVEFRMPGVLSFGQETQTSALGGGVHEQNVQPPAGSCLHQAARNPDDPKPSLCVLPSVFQGRACVAKVRQNPKLVSVQGNNIY